MDDDNDAEVAKLREELEEARSRVSRHLAERNRLIVELKAQGMLDSEIERILNAR